MPTNPTTISTPTVDRLQPAAYPEDARTYAVQMAPNLNLAKGTVVGKITASGLISEYDNTNDDGTETAVGILVHDVQTDADGNVFYGSSAVASISNPARQSTPIYTSGTFNPSNLTGWDANAVTDLGARTLVSGDVLIP